MATWKVRPVRDDEFEPWTRLDDLFVDPDARGSGAVEALFADINRIALERNWSVVRWTTADDNYRARAVYDKRATRTTWITYDMKPE